MYYNETLQTYIFICVFVYFYVLGIQTIKITELNSREKIIITGVINIIIFTTLTLTIGLRDISVGSDTENYKNIYKYIHEENTKNIFQDILFTYLTKLLRYLDNEYLYFTIVCLIFNFQIILLFKKLKINYIIGFSLFIFSFFYFTLTTNIIRNSLAIPFGIIAVNYMLDNKIKKSLVIFAIAILLHKSMIIYLTGATITKTLKGKSINSILLTILILLCFFYKNIEYLLYSYLENLTQLTDINSIYLVEDNKFDYKIGFRLDFLILNFLAIIITYLIRQKINDKLVTFIITLSVITIFSLPFPYSDRTFLLVWVFIPILLTQLIEQIKENNKIRGIIIYNLISVTLIFITFILNKK